MRVEWPPFSALSGIWLTPFFQQKVYEWPDFSGFLCERPYFSDILVYEHIFCSEILQGCLFSLYYMNWLWYLSNYLNISDDQVYEWVRFFRMTKYMNGSVFFQRLGIWMGCVLKYWLAHLSHNYPRYPPPPPPPPPSWHYENTPIQIYWKFYHQKLNIFRWKILIFFLYFCSKHRLWVLVRTASARRF